MWYDFRLILAAEAPSGLVDENVSLHPHDYPMSSTATPVILARTRKHEYANRVGDVSTLQFAQCYRGYCSDAQESRRVQ